MYLQTQLIIINSLHLHIKSLPTTIPPYLTNSEYLQKYERAIIKKTNS